MTEIVEWWKDVNPAEQHARSWARVYYYLAKEVVDTFGKDGEEALRRACANFGRGQGERIRRKVIEHGESPDLLSFRKGNMYFSPSYAIPSFKAMEHYRTAKRAFDEVTSCHFVEIWREYPDGIRLGRIFCEAFHPAMWSGFDEKLKLKMNKLITKGDPVCTFEQYYEDEEE